MLHVSRRLGVSMFQRIVVGVSKAQSAKDAAQQAKELAAAFGADVHLVIAYAGGDGAASDRERVHAESLLDSIGTAAARPMHTHVLVGDAADVIVRVAEDVDADLIVVGNKGVKKRLLGSVPSSVARKAPCSVLILATT